MEREKLGSRLGFILLSAGCAIGIGNVWKFPYMVGQYGGGIFVLLYLFFLVVLGVPVMTIEFSLGRASQKSPVRLYQQLEPKGSRWHIHGYVAMIGNYLLMMFYTTVCGWMIHYFVSTASGKFSGLSSEEVSQAFGSICADPVSMVGFMAVAVVIGFFVCSRGLQKGLERVTKVMMIALLVIMVVLAINSFTMGGAKEGLSFYLKPDVNKFMEIGVWNVVLGALTQAFFTLSLGIGAMAIFGSYIGTHFAWRIRQCSAAGYLCCHRLRSHYLPRLLYIQCGSGLRSQPDLRDSAQRIQQHDPRQCVGRIILSVHDLCRAVHCAGCI